MKNLSKKQLSNILTGLRLLQQSIESGKFEKDTLPHFDDVDALTTVEIDELSEKICLSEIKNKPNYKHASFDLLDATGETSARKVNITESDCDVHIDIDDHRLNLQNYNGELEISIVDKRIDASFNNEEIHNISLS